MNSRRTWIDSRGTLGLSQMSHILGLSQLLQFFTIKTIKINIFKIKYEFKHGKNIFIMLLIFIYPIKTIISNMLLFDIFIKLNDCIL